MDIYVESKKIALNDSMFIASGGEGEVYGKDKTIYKIYHPGKSIALSKIQELQELQKDNIIIPKEIIRDKQGNVIGYTMNWIKNSISMPKLFTNDFRNKNNFTNEMVIELVKRIITDTKYIHSKHCLIVDGNEFNYMVNEKFNTPYFIDTDSWATKNFPATALMDSIKDHHTKGFNEFTDWFAFAILATQLFVGIHPYAGRHPDFKKYDLENRMKANASIFGGNVSFPSSTRSFDLIPVRFKEWLIDVLQKGKRIDPPELDKAIAIIKQNIINTNDKVIFELVKEYNYHIINYTNKIVLTSDDTFSDSICDNMFCKNVLIGIKDGKITTKYNETNLNNILAEEYTTSENYLFVKNQDKVIQFEFIKMGNNYNLIPVTSWTVMPNSTTMYKGCYFQKVFNKLIINIPYKNNNNKIAMYQYMMPELQGYDIYDAKYEKNILNVIATKDGICYSWIFKFNEVHNSYQIVENNKTSYHNPNFTVLENGIVVFINYDDELVLFNNNFNNTSIKVINDKNIKFDMKIYSEGVKVFLTDKKKLFRIKLS